MGGKTNRGDVYYGLQTARALESFQISGGSDRPSMETTVGIVTALDPALGYEEIIELAAGACKSGKGILEIIR